METSFILCSSSSLIYANLYADWLDECGKGEEAEYLRLELNDLSAGYSDGYGYEDGHGSGYGDENGNGIGNGIGIGNGYGHGNGSGNGIGWGYG